MFLIMVLRCTLLLSHAQRWGLGHDVPPVFNQSGGSCFFVTSVRYIAGLGDFWIWVLNGSHGII